MLFSCSSVYSKHLGLQLPCGHCYVHCKCPRNSHDKYLIALGEVRVAAAQAAASAKAQTIRILRVKK